MIEMFTVCASGPLEQQGKVSSPPWHKAADPDMHRRLSMRVTLELDGDEQVVLRVLRVLLKRLVRDYGVRCNAIEVHGTGTPDERVTTD